ncbi:hypothetical protein E2P81_ATG11187 [Venturia nashicola]|nr:hypothetical protein E2P81_ATG11187 [Venturia nashicola]
MESTLHVLSANDLLAGIKGYSGTPRAVGWQRLQKPLFDRYALYPPSRTVVPRERALTGHEKHLSGPKGPLVPWSLAVCESAKSHIEVEAGKHVLCWQCRWSVSALNCVAEIMRVPFSEECRLQA